MAAEVEARSVDTSELIPSRYNDVHCKLPDWRLRPNTRASSAGAEAAFQDEEPHGQSTEFPQVQLPTTAENRGDLEACLPGDKLKNFLRACDRLSCDNDSG
jgi:hypothetical protein